MDPVEKCAAVPANDRHWWAQVSGSVRSDTLWSAFDTLRAENERLRKRLDDAEATIDDAGSYLHDVVSATTACTDLPLRLDERIESLVEWYKRDRAENGRLRARVAELEARNVALADTLYNQHVNHCTAAWTDRGLHAPECDIEDLTQAEIEAAEARRNT